MPTTVRMGVAAKLLLLPGMLGRRKSLVYPLVVAGGLRCTEAHEVEAEGPHLTTSPCVAA
jgi:hypothetical protein